jgi:hypothetical protein
MVDIKLSDLSEDAKISKKKSIKLKYVSNSKKSELTVWLIGRAYRKNNSVMNSKAPAPKQLQGEERFWIWGSHNGGYEEYYLLGYNTV